MRYIDTQKLSWNWKTAKTNSEILYTGNTLIRVQEGLTILAETRVPNDQVESTVKRLKRQWNIKV